MNQQKWLSVLALMAAFLVVLGLASGAAAQVDGGYELLRSSVDGGGGSSDGGGYALTGTAGQADTGPALDGDGYTLIGGFWPGAEGNLGMRTYLPQVLCKP